ncbi:MAG: DHHA1 domain-containing protein, partial [Akkermansia sp.]|nr:DHHA1 domain-containing protein [Akkermansia sp.]
QFFGDKYGDVVRLVQMGGEPGKFDGVSMELCGGTHVASTGKVGVFKIMSEGAIASGVRRIEAACGPAAFAYAQSVVDAHAAETADFLSKLIAANAKLDGLDQPAEPVPADEGQAEAVVNAREYEVLTAAMDAYLAYCDAVKDAALEADKRVKKAVAAAAASQADQMLEDATCGGMCEGNGVFYQEGGNELLTEILNGLRKRHFSAAMFIVVGNEDTLLLGAYCGEAARASGLKAGELMRKLAPLAGGKGGGKDDMARGSGKPDTDVDELLGKAIEAMNQH